MADAETLILEVTEQIRRGSHEGKNTRRGTGKECRRRGSEGQVHTLCLERAGVAVAGSSARLLFF